MYRKIRITVVSMVAVAISVLSSTATLSYFTDTQGTTNSFTIGNASTTLSIYNDASRGDEHIFDASDYTLTDNLFIPYYPQATNSGNIPVYHRFRVVIPISLANVITLDLPCTLSNYTCSTDDYTIVYNPSVSVNEVPTYAEYYIVSNNSLEVSGTTSEWVVTGIHVGNLSSNVDNSLFTCPVNDNSGNNCVLGISIYSDAIQTTGFTSAASAFANLAETY